jgi:hypothetical protein
MGVAGALVVWAKQLCRPRMGWLGAINIIDRWKTTNEKSGSVEIQEDTVLTEV